LRYTLLESSKELEAQDVNEISNLKENLSKAKGALAEEEKKSSGLAQENEQLKDKISRLKSKSAADKQAFHAVLVEDEEKLEDAYKDANLAGIMHTKIA
jgi:cell division protein FtsB